MEVRQGQIVRWTPAFTRGRLTSRVALRRHSNGPIWRQVNNGVDYGACTQPKASSSPAFAGDDKWEEAPGAMDIDETQDLDLEDTPAGPRVLVRFWQQYTKLLDKRPIFVKSMTSLVGFALGDMLAQVIAGTPYDVLRTVRLTLFGILMDGPIGHLWYSLLDKNVMPKKPKANVAVVVKMLLDQLVWAPFFSCVFFGFMCTLEGRPFHTIHSIQNKLVPILVANYAVWPIAHLVNFKFIPSSQRILYINVCQVLWSSFMSATQAKTA